MMRLLLVLFAVLPLLATDLDWKVGINFRATSDYVTDGDDEVYCLGETSSTQRTTNNGNSITFQWSAEVQLRNRNSGTDRRLAGSNSLSDNDAQTLTITLPQAGQYYIRLALGDYSYNQVANYIQVRDNGTPLLTVDDPTGPRHWDDAEGTDFTDTTWPEGNVAVLVTFSTTTCQMVLGTGASNAAAISHFYLEYVPPSDRRRIIVVAE